MFCFTPWHFNYAHFDNFVCLLSVFCIGPNYQLIGPKFDYICLKYKCFFGQIKDYICQNTDVFTKPYNCIGQKYNKILVKFAKNMPALYLKCLCFSYDYDYDCSTASGRPSYFRAPYLGRNGWGWGAQETIPDLHETEEKLPARRSQLQQ